MYSLSYLLQDWHFLVDGHEDAVDENDQYHQQTEQRLTCQGRRYRHIIDTHRTDATDGFFVWGKGVCTFYLSPGSPMEFV